MDYAKAARGNLSQGDFLKIIDEQAALELNHQLDASKKSLLFSRFSPELIVSGIRQVVIHNKVTVSLDMVL